jgi:alpha-N-acetylglucosamine transferase
VARKMVNPLSKRYLAFLGVGCLISLLLISVGRHGVPLSMDSLTSSNPVEPEPELPGHPFSTVQSVKHIQPHNYNSSLGNVACITFLSTRDDDENKRQEDPYFNATRLLAYKLLHDPVTATKQGIPFLVMVTATVAQWKRDQLTKDGAHVFEIDYIEIDDALMRGEPRWVDQYSKLRVFQLTGFDRLLYIDADMLIVKPLDGVFDDPAAVPGRTLDVAAVPQDELVAPDDYLIAGVDDVVGDGNRIPRPASFDFNAGFFVLRPSIELLVKYRSVMNFSERYKSNMMEQGLLNYVHRLNGNMPWKRLTPGKWNVNWPSANDYKYGVASLHDKYWERGDPVLCEMWKQDFDHMIEFFDRGRENNEPNDRY